jgi:metal-responsive CopG/Arc/MetJ family transcriptional regulator
MYTYIMQRTQIYLTKRESEALDRAARETGRTRSQLIREAVEARYLTPRDQAGLLDALEGTAGLWADRAESGEEYVERVRAGRLARIHRPA